MGLGITMMKVILGVINLLFLLAGVIMLGFGITAKADPDAVAKIFSAVLPDSSQDDLDAIGVNISGIVVSNATFMIILGVITVVIAIFGFVGACCMVRWMLIVYAIILIVLLLAEIALIIFAAVYTDTFQDEIQEGMFDTLKKYKQGLQIDGTEIIVATDALTLSWDAVQFKEKCCGAYNYSDYKKVGWSQLINATDSPISAIVPVSCCTKKKNNTVTGDTPTSLNDFENLQECLIGVEDYINLKNCYDAVKSSIEDFIDQYKFIAIGIAICICVIELLLIIFACCLCNRAKEEDKFV